MNFPRTLAVKWIRIRAILLFLLIFTVSSSAETAAQKLAPEYIETPERIILNLTENPSTETAVTWRTSALTENPEVEFAPMTEFIKSSAKTASISAAVEKTSVDNNRKVYHYSAVIKNLKPDTLYTYRVGAGENRSEWNSFKTASAEESPFTFIYMGDPQTEVKSKCSQIFRAAFKKAPHAAFWLFGGDIVNSGDNDMQWEEFHQALGWISAVTPIALIPGNHEYPDRRTLKGEYKIFHLWRPQFTLPENGPAGLEETAYYIDYQGVRFVMLNGNEKIEEQAEWLNRILSENSQGWTIVSIHQPVYSIPRHGKESKLKKHLAPVIEKHSVDLVLQGHDHIYSRSHRIKNGAIAEKNKNGTVYIISVSGPKFYPESRTDGKLLAKIISERQLFHVISIEKNRLIFKAYDLTGEAVDSFIIEK